MDVLKEFFDSSTIHGLAHITSAQVDIDIKLICIE